MKIHRFLSSTPLVVGSFDIANADLVHQIRTVLKLRTGERIVLLDGNGMECDATIEEIGKATIRVTVSACRQNTSEATRHVTLYCAVLKRENFDLVLQKATELGVQKIVPLVTARTVKLDVKRDRAERILREATEQCGRGRVPVLEEPLAYKDACVHADANDVNVFCDLGEGEGVMDVLRRIQSASTVGLFIGPEGGWTSEEREEAERRAWTVTSFGSRTLRGETAAIVAAFIGTIE